MPEEDRTRYAQAGDPRHVGHGLINERGANLRQEELVVVRVQGRVRVVMPPRQVDRLVFNRQVMAVDEEPSQGE